MPVGFECYDQNGKLQFNDSMFCYFLRKTGSGTTGSANVGNTDPSSIQISASGYTNPIIAIQCSATVAFYGLFGGNYWWACSGGVGTAFNYFVYDRSSAIPASNFGVEVVDASGVITFSSNYRPMQVVSFLDNMNYSSWMNPGSSQSVTFGGKSLAVAQGETGGHRYAGPMDYYLGGMQVLDPYDPSGYDSTGYQNDAKLYGGVISNSNQTATTGYVGFDDVYIGGAYSGINNPPPDWQRQLKLFVVDVTGVPIGTTFF
jgi:hypothetical protein